MSVATTTRSVPTSYNQDALVVALFDAVRFLVSCVQRRPEWSAERDDLLETVARDTAAGKVEPEVLALLRLLFADRT